MTISCKHNHRLELQKFFNFFAAHSPVRLAIETKILYFFFLRWLTIIRNHEFCLYADRQTDILLTERKSIQTYLS